MIDVRKANEYSSCLSCGSDKDVYVVTLQNPHSCNTLEVTLCSSCLLSLVEKMQYIGITLESSKKLTNADKYFRKAMDAELAKLIKRHCQEVMGYDDVCYSGRHCDQCIQDWMNKEAR